jgi:hypothetical protein
LYINVLFQPSIERQVALIVWETAKKHEIAHTGEPEELAGAKHFEKPQQAPRANLLTADMKGTEYIGIKKAMWYAQTT